MLCIGSCSWLTSPQLARMGEFISYLCVLLIVKFQVIFLRESDVVVTTFEE